MKKTILGLLVLMLIASGVFADAPVLTPGWSAIVIREANDGTTGAPAILDNDTYQNNSVEIGIVASGQKAGIATDLINGIPVSHITSLHIDRLDDVASSGSLYGPYFNIWITDGLGNYAVIANEPSDAEWAGSRWDVASWDFLKTKRCKVYETANASAGTSWVHTYALAHGWDGILNDLTFENVGGLTIEPPSPAYIAASSDIGTGAPDELGTNIARGYTWVFGDTASNYVAGGDGFIVNNYSATATFPVNNTTLGLGYFTISAAIAGANPGNTITVAPGNYVEEVHIDKSLNIYGATAGMNKNGYTVPANYAWDPAVESIITHPDPASGYVAIVDIDDVDDVIFDGFVVGELNAVGNANTSLVRAYAHTREITNVNVVNCVIGPNTNLSGQDGAQGRMGLYLVNHPYDDKGIVNSTFAHNKIFDCKGNGDNIFLWTSYYAYGAPGPADMHDTVIEDNEIYGAHRSGIETAGGFANLTIRDNTIYGQSGLPGDDPNFLKYGHGIQLIRGSSDKVSDPLTAYGPQDLTVENNEIYGNQKCGVYMGPKNSGVHFVDNIIRDNGWNGVMLDLEGNYWNPTFESPPVSGAYACFDCSDNITASGNQIFGNGTQGNPIAQYGMQITGTPTNGLVVGAEVNWWGDASGPLDTSDDTGSGGLYNPNGLGDQVTDHIDYYPWQGMADGSIAPATTGPLNCSQTITLTFNYTADEHTPDMFLYNAVVNATPGLIFGAITDLEPFGTVNNNFYALNTATDQWTITGSTVGNPSYPMTGAGTTGLFSIVFSATGDVVGDVTLESLTLRDPDNHTIPVTLSGASITYDCTPPDPVTDITAAPGFRKVNVSWTASSSTDVDHYAVFSGLWHNGTVGTSAYPEYDDVQAYVPARPGSYAAADASTEWAGPFTAAGLAYTQSWNDSVHRGVYTYEVYAVDTAGNISAPAAANDRATNYWLGDVSAIDGIVDVSDMSWLGTYFGTTIATGAPGNDTDVGPTDDWSRVGIPLTDSRIDFEDLMVFSMNFGVVTGAKSKAPLSNTVDLAWVTNDDGTMALRLVGGGGLKGVRVTAAQPVNSVTAGRLLDDQSELTFLKNVGTSLDASVAVMGINNGFSGQGDLMVVSAENPIAVENLKITARGIDNSTLKVNLTQTTGTATPRVFSLNANYPNPFNPMTKISFSLPEAQNVELIVFGIDGKRVATLMNGQQEAGLHEVIWQGRDDSGKSVATGTYFYQIKAGPYSQVRKMSLIK